MRFGRQVAEGRRIRFRCEYQRAERRLRGAQQHDPVLIFGDQRRGVTEFYDRLVHASSIQLRSEEHTSELQSLMRISYAVFCLKKKNMTTSTSDNIIQHNQTIQ